MYRLLFTGVYRAEYTPNPSASLKQTSSVCANCRRQRSFCLPGFFFLVEKMSGIGVHVAAVSRIYFVVESKLRYSEMSTLL